MRRDREYRRRGSQLILLAALLPVMACATKSTTLVSTWRDPAVTGPRKFDKALVVVVDRNPAMRRTVEDRIVARIPGSVASYTIVPEDRLRDEPFVQSQIQAGGFDGAVVMRFLDTQKSQQWVPGAGPTYVGGFGGYWGSTWGATYDPGYMRETTTVTAETSIYDLKVNKLIWAGRSETVDPKSVPDLVAGIADAATAELVKEGLVAQAPEQP
jgi:hypothetical protein